MVDDVGDTAIVEQFVADYLRLLDLRIESLRRQLSGSDFDAASISLLTLKSSSDMVGGGEVAAAARQLRYAVDHRQGEDITALLDRLLTSVSVLAGELADVELRPRPTPHPVAE